LLTAGAFVASEWVRPPVEPLPTHSSRVRWVDSDILILHESLDCSTPPRGGGSLEAARDKLRDLRFWAAKYHERNGGPYEPVECWARVLSASTGEVRARVLSNLPLDSRWRFLARLESTQYECSVASYANGELIGTATRATALPPGFGQQNGVLLLRPVYLRSPPALELDAVESEARRMQQSIEISRDVGHPIPRPDIRSRVLSVVYARGRTLVTIAAGNHDGVSVGDEARMSRGSSFVGFASVIRVLEHSAVAEFDPEFPGTGAPPRATDWVFIREAPSPAPPPR